VLVLLCQVVCVLFSCYYWFSCGLLLSAIVVLVGSFCLDFQRSVIADRLFGGIIAKPPPTWLIDLNIASCARSPPDGPTDIWDVDGGERRVLNRVNRLVHGEGLGSGYYTPRKSERGQSLFIGVIF
jgi:hypothetical protein